jgi:hypothetical protein
MNSGITAFEALNVALAIVALGSGVPVLCGLLAARRSDLWMAIFLTANVLANVSGLLFPVKHFSPPQALTILSLGTLVIAIYARYARQLAGPWGRINVASAVTVQYLNVLVLVAEGFQSVPFLKAIAPSQSEPAFLRIQFALLAVFVVLGISAANQNRSTPVQHGGPRC